MAILQFVTHGMQSAQEYNASGGTISYSQGVVNWDFSPSTLEVGPTTTAVGWVEVVGIGANGTNTALSLATTYVSFYFSYLTAPATGSEEILQVRQGTNVKFTVRLNSAGKLDGYNAGGTTLVGTGTTVLDALQWYRLDLKVGSSATVGAYELKINSAIEWSGTTNTNANNATNVRFGKVADRSSQDVYYYYGPIVIDNAAYVSEPYFYATSWSPVANGSTMDWTSGTAPSDFSQVSEVPPSNTEYVKNSGAAAGQVALFDFDNRADIGFDFNSLPLSVKGRIRIAEDVSTTSSQKIRMRSQNSTNNDTTGFNGTASYATLSNLQNTDPHTSAAWTGAALDDIEIGAVESNAVSDRCSFVMLDILFYTPIKPSTSESVTITDYPNDYKDKVFVSDKANVALQVVDLLINKSESVTLSENVLLLLESLINKFDSTILTEAIQREVNSFNTSSESITAVENVAGSVSTEVSQSESVTVNENVVSSLLSLIAAAEAVTITENNQIQVLLDISATETITATEIVVTNLESFLSVSDLTSISESVNLETANFLSINVSDIVGGNPPKFIYTTDGDALIYVFRSGDKWFYEKV